MEELGCRVVLPSSYIGSDRAMQQLYQDSMAIVRHFGKPTFFITFTANPKWPEITHALFPGQQAADRPNLIARVFHLKVRSLLADLRAGVLGEYAGHVYTIEYQKRGLPHMHLLLFIKGFNFNVPNLIDEVVCAELPHPSWDVTGELTDVVVSTMTHGPCGDDYHVWPVRRLRHLYAVQKSSQSHLQPLLLLMTRATLNIGARMTGGRLRFHGQVCELRMSSVTTVG